MKKTNAIILMGLSLLLSLEGCNSDSVAPVGKINISSNPGNIKTIAGLGAQSFGNTGDGGLATLATLGWITALSVDQLNNVYITDGASNTVRLISAATGFISTVAGNGTNGDSGDGGMAKSAQLNIPLSITVDVDGNVIFIDAGNNVVRVVSFADGKISSIIGTRGQGYAGNNGPATAALLFNPYSIAADHSGNLYLAELGNHVIRMISKSSGKITSLAGQGPSHPGYSGDNGLATSATLNSPHGVAVDAEGTIYISDSGNNVIRKIKNGIITTIAGTGVKGYSGDGANALVATFYSLSGIAVDAAGNVYVADTGNNVIRKIDTASGVISTVAGNGVVGYTGDGGAATSAKLSGPLGVAVDSNGNIFIADTGNSAIRVVSK